MHKNQVMKFVHAHRFAHNGCSLLNANGDPSFLQQSMCADLPIGLIEFLPKHNLIFTFPVKVPDDGFSMVTAFLIKRPC
jgi:hypothetical protein